MKVTRLRAIGIAFGLLLLVYVPTFIAVSLIRPPVQSAIPLIIGISLTIALALILRLARLTAGTAEFGFRIPKLRFVGLAVLLGLPLAIGASWLVHLFPAKSPIDTSGLPLWMISLYFVVGASIQEEIVFRGLLQSYLQQRWTATFSLFGFSVSLAVAFTAALFGAVHLESGLAVFAGAIVLGLVAGELRRRSGSLLPAVTVHAIFNLPGLLLR